MKGHWYERKLDFFKHYLIYCITLRYIRAACKEMTRSSFNSKTATRLGQTDSSSIHKQRWQRHPRLAEDIWIFHTGAFEETRRKLPGWKLPLGPNCPLDRFLRLPMSSSVAFELIFPLATPAVGAPPRLQITIVLREKQLFWRRDRRRVKLIVVVGECSDGRTDGRTDGLMTT